MFITNEDIVRPSAVVIFCFLPLAGCGLFDTAITTSKDAAYHLQLAVGSGSAAYTDRCIDIMRASYSAAHMDITNVRVGMSIKGAVVDVQATRKDVPVGSATPRDIAAQCRFDEGIVVDFHWTANPLK